MTKFELWDKKTKTMLRKVYDAEKICDEEINIGSDGKHHWNILTMDLDDIMLSLDGDMVSISDDTGKVVDLGGIPDRFILRRYAGIHVQGKPLREYDLVRLNDEQYTFLVLFRFCGFDLSCVNKKTWCSPYIYGFKNRLQIVGNLMENPELVEDIKPEDFKSNPELEELWNHD